MSAGFCRIVEKYNANHRSRFGKVCTIIRPPLWGFCVLCLFCYAILCGLSCFSIIMIKLIELAALQLLSSLCLVTISVLWLFLAMPCVGLHCVIVVFPCDTCLPLSIKSVI